ncbi:MAG: threonine/serine dehydratase [Deinococcota bacterium]|jgi:threonine dehydratase|nr:threonine/serine dehydratase [Deinococcota bacterium]
MPDTPHRLSLERIDHAARVIDPVFLNSPQFVCEPLGDELGVRLVLKLETLNPIRSFKGRGADFFMSTLDGLTPQPRLVCASAGNFGQAMAFAARRRGLAISIFAAETANPFKLERMRALGAELRLHGDDFDAAKLEAKRFAREAGARMVEDGLDPETAEGAGTMGLELLRLPDAPDVLLVPLGNGAMIGGVGRVIKAYRPSTQVIAVQAAGAPAMTESWRSGRLVTHQRIDTIADGIGVRVPVPEALTDLRGLIDDALLVSDEATLRAMRLLHRHVGVVVEPSGAVGVAALLEHPERMRGGRVGTLLCGGNLTLEQMRAWL